MRIELGCFGNLPHVQKNTPHARETLDFGSKTRLWANFGACFWRFSYAHSHLIKHKSSCVCA